MLLSTHSGSVATHSLTTTCSRTIRVASRQALYPPSREHAPDGCSMTSMSFARWSIFPSPLPPFGTCNNSVKCCYSCTCPILILTEHARSSRNSIMGGECPTSKESPYRVSCIIEALVKQKKNASAQGSLKFREVSNSFWEGTWR